MVATRVLAAFVAAGFLWACGSSDSNGGKGGNGGTGGEGGAGGEGGEGGSGGELEDFPYPGPTFMEPFPHGECGNPQPHRPWHTVERDVLPPDPSTRWVGAGADTQGNVYFADRMGKTFWRKADGTIEQIVQTGTGEVIHGLTMMGDVAWTFAGRSFIGGPGTLARFEDGDYIQRNFPDLAVMGVFQMPDGRIAGQFCDAADCRFYEILVVDGALEIEPIQGHDGRLGDCEFVKALPRFGFVARCDSYNFAVGPTAADLAIIATGDQFDTARFGGRQPNDIWGLQALGENLDEGYLLNHWSGSSWTVAENSPRIDNGVFLSIANNDVVVFTDKMIWYFNGACWQKLLPEDAVMPLVNRDTAGPVYLGDRKVGWLHAGHFYTLRLPAEE